LPQTHRARAVSLKLKKPGEDEGDEGLDEGRDEDPDEGVAFRTRFGQG
jgi:hypothetical protein